MVKIRSLVENNKMNRQIGLGIHSITQGKELKRKIKEKDQILKQENNLKTILTKVDSKKGESHSWEKDL